VDRVGAIFRRLFRLRVAALGVPAMQLIVSRCNSCHATVYPARAICPYCRSDNTTAIGTHSAQGEVLSYTSLEMPPEGFTPPVVLALVKLSNGATVLALASTEDILSLAIGAVVTVEVGSNGLLILTPP
jgi:uncharacterized OB-fold protein